MKTDFLAHGARVGLVRLGLATVVLGLLAACSRPERPVERFTFEFPTGVGFG
jgi:hypothetical protein